MTPLEAASNQELIDELLKRGTACAIGMVVQDGDTGADHIRMGLYQGGEADMAMFAASNLLERTIVHAEDAGVAEDQMSFLLELIMYDPDKDPERIERGDILPEDITDEDELGE